MLQMLEVHTTQALVLRRVKLVLLRRVKLVLRRVKLVLTLVPQLHDLAQVHQTAELLDQLLLVKLVQLLVLALMLLLRDSTHLPRAEDGFKETRLYALVLHQLR